VTIITPLVPSSARYIPPPSGWTQLTAPIYYDITTTAAYTGPVEVCLTSIFPTPAAARLLHYDGGKWVDITYSSDVTTRRACGLVSALLRFVLAVPPPPTASPSNSPTAALVPAPAVDVLDTSSGPTVSSARSTSRIGFQTRAMIVVTWLGVLALHL
jgi:hypothetical protein